jgi:threonyl-tRNA synthetase
MLPECSPTAPFIGQVVGEQEAKEGKVNVRTRDNKVHGAHSIASLLAVLAEEKSTRSNVCCFAKEDAAADAAADAPTDAPTAEVAELSI